MASAKINKVMLQPDGRVLVAFADKLVLEWPSFAALRAEVEAFADDPDLPRKILLASLVRKGGRTLAAFRNNAEGKTVSFDASASNLISEA